MLYQIVKLGLIKKSYAFSDQSGVERYRVESRLFGSKYRLRNSQGETLIEFAAHLASYEFVRNGQKVARMPIHLFRSASYDSYVELSSGQRIQIKKDLWGDKYILVDESGELAKASRPHIAGSEKGYLETRGGEDDLLLLALYVAIDDDSSRKGTGPGSGP
jgi:uncharacterized protein YxjI